MSKETGQAMDTLRQALSEDPSYAYSWHANIAMAVYDAWGPVETNSDQHKQQLKVGNEAASRFMKLCFDVDTNQDMLLDKS